MKIIAISDLHGNLPRLLPDADVVCVVGDIFPECFDNYPQRQWIWYNNTYLEWVEKLNTRKVITVAGNHDCCFLEYSPITTDKHIYLENTGCVVEGYTFYGTPNTRPQDENLAFSEDSARLKQIFNKIPHKLDFLLCHSSPYGVNDCGMLLDRSEDMGCKELTKELYGKCIRYIFCGHIHSGNHNLSVWECGRVWNKKKIVNVSYCNSFNNPAYEPFIIETKTLAETILDFWASREGVPVESLSWGLAYTHYDDSYEVKHALTVKGKDSYFIDIETFGRCEYIPDTDWYSFSFVDARFDVGKGAFTHMSSFGKREVEVVSKVDMDELEKLYREYI